MASRLQKPFWSGIALGWGLAVAPGLVPAGDEGPILYYENLGDYSRAVTTDSESAQAWFDQGLRLAYGFARQAAADAFLQATRHDPDCALCHWGAAWVLGPYQNNPGGVGERAEAAAAAQAALRALSRAEAVAPWEQALVEAMAQRYPDGSDQAAATAPYAEAMERAAVAHPDDPDVQTLYAEALMMFRPWDLHDEEEGPYPETQAAVQALEGVLADHPQHPGACHLYIHAVEAWEPQRAEACADRLADAIPGVSHIQHMPSHIYMHVGRFGDAVHQNQQARIMDQAAARGAGVSVYPTHNTAMLAFAAWMDGQSGVALSAARDLARESPGDAFHYDLLLARFGRWDQLADRDDRPEMPFQAGMWHFAQGLAALRSRGPEAASGDLQALRRIRDNTPEEATYQFFGHPKQDLLGIAEEILAAEVALAEGRDVDAEAALREAVRLEDRLPYSEPEPWPIPARHVLGAVLLEIGDAEEAESVYREALSVHPDNGWALRGLQQSLAAQGKAAEARQVAEAFEQAWQRADIWLPGSRF
ncbi:hypothetical protein [Alkalilimnicola ehrlichii]|uniref:hypothetical protein n=1 Tax=Alkalilimnicola ehrlichii TaxID=351052 RepID=UPI003B9DF10F